MQRRARELPLVRYPERSNEPDPLTMKISSSIVGFSSDPDIFGPPFWFVLHNAAVTYPRNPTLFVKNGMKSLLLNLPLLVPCINCREHFSSFLNNTNLDNVVKSKDTIFTFFVNVHNYVNKRTGKREMSVDEAKVLYGFDRPGGTTMRIKYE